MHVLIELWKARPLWSELSPSRREEYLTRVVPAIRRLLSDGVELMAMEAAGNGGREYDYWAVWRLPHRSQLDAFAVALEEVGWETFFERVPLDVEGRTVEDIMADMPRAH